jgi:hypothetical protein
VAANASLITTETELFSLPAGQVIFHVSNDTSEDGPPVIVNTNNGPQSPTPSLLNFNQFNPLLGTLLGVSVTFTTTYGATSKLNVTSGPFDNGTIGTVDFFGDGTIDLLLSGAGFIANQPSTQTANATCPIVTTTPRVLDEKTCSNTAANNGNFNGTVSGLSLAPFLGTGTFNLTASLISKLLPRVSPDNGTGFADNSTMDGTLDSNWAGSVSVVYTYDVAGAAVPEPWTLYLVIAALAGLAWVPRRRT